MLFNSLTTYVQLGGAEESSCEDTGVVSLTFDYYYELLVFTNVFTLIIQLCI